MTGGDTAAAAIVQRDAEFFSDGLRLRAILQTPDAGKPANGFPAILICSGRMGLKEWIPPRWAPAFIARGIAAMAFDYRNLGSSEGERGRLLPEEEIRDVSHAVTFLQQQPDIDGGRIGVVGFGLGGGIAVAAAARDDRIKAVAAVNGVGDAGRVCRQSVPAEAWRARQEEIAADRIGRVLDGRSATIPQTDVMRPGQTGGGSFDFRAALENAVGKGSSREGGLGHGLPDFFTLESVEALYAFRPEAEAHKIAPRPLLVVHGEDNDYHPLAEGQALFDRAGEPKSLTVIPGAGHLDWIEPHHPMREATLDGIANWFEQHIGTHSRLAETRRG